ncbi:C40 family peptidase [Oceanirhabdus seepicola]|uniref:C40 family peptidase n=2 Tax=Oceanirhabdus seepicola TaxID=2828781 RepID=A0A9J6P2R8_9CLOT|nr:C40 family peptidase [Oceanirhabdus seepicola]
MRYNTTNDKLSVIFKDKPEGYYSSLKFINNTNLICFNYKENTLDKENEEFSFIGVLQEDTIKNIQKLPFDDLSTDGKRNYSFILNENGSSLIRTTHDYYRKNSMDYTFSKFYIYKIDNIKTVLRTDNAIIFTAIQFLGTPYFWGGNTPETGFDTSGLVQYVYKQNGITLGRTTYQQIDQGIHVSKDNLKTGDLIFFGTSKDPHHVGIYVGNNHFIHAPRTGDVVKISSLSSRKDFLTARRILK